MHQQRRAAFTRAAQSVDYFPGDFDGCIAIVDLQLGKRIREQDQRRVYVLDDKAERQQIAWGWSAVDTLSAYIHGWIINKNKSLKSKRREAA